MYELCSILTHQGMSSNSGHYIGYAKNEKHGLLRFDDVRVTGLTNNDIHKLYGGGKTEMAYKCFYRKVKL